MVQLKSELFRAFFCCGVIQLSVSSVPFVILSERTEKVRHKNWIKDVGWKDDSNLIIVYYTKL